MKKIIYILFFVISLFSLTSCEINILDIFKGVIEEVPDSENNSDIDKTPISSLETPVLVIDNDTGIVTWEVVACATHYNYIINDGQVLTTTTNTITLPKN